MSSYVQYVTTAVATAGVVGGAYCAYRLYKNASKVKIPENWTQVGTLKDLYIYPIKSCGAVRLDKAECSLLGLRDGWLRDRILMVVDEKNNFITARAYPELLLVEPSMKSSVLTLNQANMESISTNLAEIVALQKPETATVWGVTVPVYDCGWAMSEWFSRLLDRSTTNYRLVYYASQCSRGLRIKFLNALYKIGTDDTGALPDEVPFNLINEASVDELNTRLEETKVKPEIFRPNFILTGAKPYDEDNWKFVKIGENVFEIIKPCTRCIMTTIDPETGVRNPKAEPLETLKKYRQLENPLARRSAGNSPRMGLQMALRSGPGGIISLNDPIYVA
ncbi:mitochondrial amidoxime reducing component [Aphomia sociella]